MYTVGGIFISYMVLVWYLNEKLVGWYVWGATLAGLIICIFGAQVAHDMYFISYYLDNHLRPKVTKLLGDTSILQFEIVLKRYRKAKFAFPIEAIWIPALLIVLIYIALKHNYTSNWEYIGFIVNLAAYLYLIQSIRKGFNLLNNDVHIEIKNEVAAHH
jgi:hypothetical protein